MRGIFAAFIHSCESPTDVGYANNDMSAKKYNAAGACFVSTDSADGSFKLGDIVAEGFNWENDEIRVINPETSATSVRLIYLDKETADAYEMEQGWYEGSELEPYNNVSFTLGTGFLTSFGSSAVKFTSAGQVYEYPITIDCSSKKYTMVPNPLPRGVKLSEVSATGFNWEDDELRIMNPATSGTNVRLIYLDKETADSFEMEAGWYEGNELEPYGNYEIKPGDGMMLSSGSKSVKINFPSAL